MAKNENPEQAEAGGSIAEVGSKLVKDTRALVNKHAAKEGPEFSPAKATLLGLIGFVFLFMLLSMGLQGGWSGLGIAWAAMLVLSFIGGFIGGLMRLFWIEAPRIGILAALFSLLWLLEFKIGAYNLWRDFIALLAAMIVTVVLCRWVLPRLPKWFDRFILLVESTQERTGVEMPGVRPATAETTRTELIEAVTAGERQPDSQRTDEDTAEKHQGEFHKANAGQTGKNRVKH